MSISTTQQEIINKTVQEHTKTKFMIYCQTCGKIFYIGTFYNYIQTFEQGTPRDFHVLALQHAWDNSEHNVISQVPENDPHTELYDQVLPNYVPSFTEQAKQLKNQCRTTIKPFVEHLTERSIVKCSKCQTKYYGKNSLTLAVECCKNQKVVIE